MLPTRVRGLLQREMDREGWRREGGLCPEAQKHPRPGHPSDCSPGRDAWGTCQSHSCSRTWRAAGFLHAPLLRPARAGATPPPSTALSPDPRTGLAQAEKQGCLWGVGMGGRVEGRRDNKEEKEVGGEKEEKEEKEVTGPPAQVVADKAAPDPPPSPQGAPGKLRWPFSPKPSRTDRRS